jgi:hypothetical protein
VTVTDHGRVAAAVTQAPTDVVMIRPLGFRPNPMTAADNRFQSVDPSRDPLELSYAAYREVTLLADTLRGHGVNVQLFDDVGHDLPDSVFPNNWFSSHADGRLALYPMFSPNRRGERRPDIIEALQERYRVTEVVDYSGLEGEDVFLEGTGAMVLDHVHRTAFVARSHRAHDRAVEVVCRDLGYTPLVFTTTDRTGTAIYHTNVMMSVGTSFAMVGLETIVDADERRAVADRITGSGRALVDLTHAQVEAFAGNAIELQGTAGRLLVLSARAHASLRADQLAVVARSCTVVPVAVPTIELAGGSVRCMIAGVHTEQRPTAAAAAATAHGEDFDTDGEPVEPVRAPHRA